MVNILCTTLLVVASLQVGLAYPRKSSSLIELETHEASVDEDDSKELIDLKKEIKSISEDIDVDKDNEQKLQDEDDSSMQDEYDDEYGNGMTRNDDSQQIITQNKYEKLISQTDKTKASYYYKLYCHFYALAMKYKKDLILKGKRYRQSRKESDFKLALKDKLEYLYFKKLYFKYYKSYSSLGTGKGIDCAHKDFV